MENILKQLGQIIKKARQAAELTQEELAEHVGITARYIMAIENYSYFTYTSRQHILSRKRIHSQRKGTAYSDDLYVQ